MLRHGLGMSGRLRGVAPLLGVLAVGWFWTGAAAQDKPSQPGTDARPHVAMAGFQVGEGIDARDVWLAVAIEETLAWRLRRVPALRVVPTVRIHQARRELQDEGAPEPAWSRVATALGADRLLSGRCGGSPDAVSLRLVLVELGPSPVERAQAMLPSASLFDVLDTATRWALGELGVDGLPVETEKLIFAPPCRSPSALEYYARAVPAARSGDLDNARYYVMRSLDYDTRYRPALALLAQLELQAGMVGSAPTVARLRVLGDLARVNADPHDQAVADLGQGVALQMRGAFDAAYGRYERALAISYQQGAPYGQVAAINNICDLYLTRRMPTGVGLSKEQLERFTRQNLRRAAEWQEVGLQLLRELGDVVAEAPTAHKLALVYGRLGENELALATHRQTLAAAERYGSRRNQASAWLYIGQCHQRAGRWPEALEALNRCLALASEDLQPIARLALAATYRSMEAPDKALAEFERVYKQICDGEDLAGQLMCGRQIAELRRQLGRHEAALTALKEAIEIAHALRSPEETALREQLVQWQSMSP